MKGLSLSQSKKGQVGNLAPAIMALVFAAIVLVFGLIITQSLRDTGVLKNTATVANESNIWANGTDYTVVVEEGARTETYALTAVWGSYGTASGPPNCTGIADIGLGYNVTIPTANLTITTNGGVTGNASTCLYDNVSISYSYQSGDTAWDASNSTVKGLGTFADFWEIIVLAIIITVVIGLLIGVFGGRSPR